MLFHTRREAGCTEFKYAQYKFWYKLNQRFFVNDLSRQASQFSLLVFHCNICINLLKPTVYVMHYQFNIQQLYALPTLYLCVLYLSENKQRLVPPAA